MADGVIPPGALSDGNSGMVVSGPKGSIQLDKEDTIIAGTNLGGDGGEKGGGKQINFDLTPLLNKMDQLINAVQSSKTVSVDGYQLNEAIHLEKLPEGVG